MEWVWIILASLGAGIGTGLAGLSAATVMVPILVVLCPSFAGEKGAYQATAIALASDILGSAVTSYTYAKNKNIDIKRAGLMMTIILILCTIGSYIAYLVGNIVLGSFTLFLTFCIGIRFLVKPDTSRKELATNGEKLGIKEIIVSIFFGLTIGFGTGFVGTGGGMMMLIVFTVFFHMNLKTAVGTSTFIMTFTALIASVSHILIHPAIVLEKWDILIVCIIVATVSSLLSARFANRVKNRTIGLVTGAVLTVLGAILIILNFWDYLSQFELIVDILYTIVVLTIYVVVALMIVIPIKFLTKIPSFVFRKLLHIIAFSLASALVIVSKDWIVMTLVCILVAVCAYPILMLLEKEAWFNGLFVQKSSGEIKRSMCLLFIMCIILATIVWGIFDKPYIIVVSIVMWGIGDAAAALIGVPFGEHKIKLADGKKSVEGSLAMFIASFAFGITIAAVFNVFEYPLIIWYILLGSALGTIVELFTSSEYDTITVPIAISTLLLILRML